MTFKRGVITGICALLASFISVMAQDEQLTLDDLIPGGKTAKQFLPDVLPQIQWYGDQYLFVEDENVIAGVPGKKGEVVFSLETLNKVLADASLQTLKTLPVFSFPVGTEPVIAFRSNQHRIHYNFETNKIEADYQLSDKWGNYDYTIAGYLAFTEGNNLKILSPDNKVIVVTHEADEGIVCGQAVHQREFGITKGTFWSPTGASLAFYRMDETMVTTYPLVNTDARCAEYVPHKYPMAGMKSHEVTLGVFHVQTGKTVWLQTGLPKEKYLTNIAWSPDEKSIYIAELNRGQNEMNLVRYSALTGEKEAVLFTEKSPEYVEPGHPVLFVPNKPDQFIWQSDRDGYNHLYLYDTTGRLIKQLTSGKWVVQRMLGFDVKGDNLFFSGTAPHPEKSVAEGTPMEVYAWRVNLKSGKRTCITKNVGVHSVTISPSGLYAIDRYSTPTLPHVTDLIRIKDGKEVASMLISRDPFADYTLPEIVSGTIKAADEVTDLHYRLLKPAGFDENKKYPTVIYVYGGPHSQQVTGGWLYGTRGWEIYMAQRGYVVYVMDNRGTCNRGRDFEQVIHRQLGEIEMADQMKGVEYLKSLPYVDADRIGVHGWSYGGFMTTNLMTTYPDVFKVGVAGGPVIDWSLYEIMYGERYMDSPQENPEGYAKSNLNNKAGNLKGRLLLIHGTMDPVVVWQHSLTFMKACVDANTYPDYFVYPGHPHNVSGKDRIHLHEKITRYFDDFLK